MKVFFRCLRRCVQCGTYIVHIQGDTQDTRGGAIVPSSVSLSMLGAFHSAVPLLFLETVLIYGPGSFARGGEEEEEKGRKNKRSGFLLLVPSPVLYS